MEMRTEKQKTYAVFGDQLLTNRPLRRPPLAQRLAAPKTGLPAEAGSSPHTDNQLTTFPCKKLSRTRPRTVNELTNSGYMTHQLVRVYIIPPAERLQVGL
jgi:hypothetical protein